MKVVCMKFCLYRYSWVVTALIVISVSVSVCTMHWSEGGGGNWKTMLTFVGLSLSFFYFFQRQKLAETRLMKELITDFNSRYDALNEELKAIVDNPSSKLTRCKCETLDDYFNLCAEEYFFYTFGSIDPRVWKAWHEGMKEYSKDQRIRERWKKEEKSESYYGFTFPSGKDDT